MTLAKPDKKRGTRRKPPAGGPLRPEVAEFMRVRESLRDPEVYRNPERLEEVKKGSGSSRGRRRR